MERFRTFNDFWPFYVSEHSSLANRRMHFVGTLIGLACVAQALIAREPFWLLGAPLAGYAFAWLGHFFVERNRPATFKYPMFSLMGDYKMFALTLGGRMEEEVRKAEAWRAARAPARSIERLP